MNKIVQLGQVPAGDPSGAAEVKRNANELIKAKELVTLNRECDAIQIPSGEKMMLPAGTQVRIMQSLGGTYTVTTNLGSMVRIAAQDADALGLETPPEATPEPSVAGEEDTEKLVWKQLKTCFDPEIPVNIVDLPRRCEPLASRSSSGRRAARWSGIATSASTTIRWTAVSRARSSEWWHSRSTQ